jgi:hypothetical protein
MNVPFVGFAKGARVGGGKLSNSLIDNDPFG